MQLSLTIFAAIGAAYFIDAQPDEYRHELRRREITISGEGNLINGKTLEKGTFKYDDLEALGLTTTSKDKGEAGENAKPFQDNVKEAGMTDKDKQKILDSKTDLKKEIPETSPKEIISKVELQKMDRPDGDKTKTLETEEAKKIAKFEEAGKEKNENADAKFLDDIRKEKPAESTMKTDKDSLKDNKKEGSKDEPKLSSDKSDKASTKEFNKDAAKVAKSDASKQGSGVVSQEKDGNDDKDFDDFIASVSSSASATINGSKDLEFSKVRNNTSLALTSSSPAASVKIVDQKFDGAATRFEQSLWVTFTGIASSALFVYF